ncbi:MAG TPA: hypothetical protein PKW21_06765 [Rhabdaerophilum sp.]|nr:hypothetical protein [Rhabdaerophilum sp.]
MTKASISALSVLAMLASTVEVVRAAGFTIDPDPASPTLGELVDRENSVASALRGPAEGRPRPVVVRVPATPREAVTVIVPGRRLR